MLLTKQVFDERNYVFGRGRRGQHKSCELTSFPPDPKVAVAAAFTAFVGTVAAAFVAKT